MAPGRAHPEPVVRRGDGPSTIGAARCGRQGEAGWGAGRSGKVPDPHRRGFELARPLAAVTGVAVRLGLARSFQDVRLFERMTVLDNVLVALPTQPGERLGPLFFAPRRTAKAERRNRDQALGSLAFVGLADRAGEIASSLAFGEQKLVALARLIATGADVLLLDEPASGVDLQWVRRILDLIRQLAASGKTVCIVEHNLEVVTAVADHAYFMEAGRIIAEGRPEELMADPRLADIYFGTSRR